MTIKEYKKNIKVSPEKYTIDILSYMKKNKPTTIVMHPDDLAELQVLAAQASAQLRDTVTVKYADIIRHALSNEYGLERRGRIANRLKEEWSKQQ